MAGGRATGREKGWMSVRWSKWTIGAVATGVVGLAAAGVAGIAAAAVPSGTGQTSGPAAALTSFLADVAQHLGVQPSALQSAIQQADIDQVNQLQASGKITAQQASDMIARIQSGQAPLFPGRGFGGGGRGHRGGPGPMGGPGGDMQAAAAYLGLTPQQLASDLQSGQTLAQIADGTAGKSSQGLAAALTSDLQSRLDQAVKDGKITAAQGQTQISNFQSNLQNLLSRTLPAGGPGGGPHGTAWWGGPPPTNGGGAPGGSANGSSSSAAQTPTA